MRNYFDTIYDLLLNEPVVWISLLVVALAYNFVPHICGLFECGELVKAWLEMSTQVSIALVTAWSGYVLAAWIPKRNKRRLIGALLVLVIVFITIGITTHKNLDADVRKSIVGITLEAILLALLIGSGAMLGAVIGDYLKGRKPTDVNSTGRKPMLVGMYNKITLKDRNVTLWYWIAALLVMWVVWMHRTAESFATPEIMVSLVVDMLNLLIVLCLGFIIIYLVNQEYNRKRSVRECNLQILHNVYYTLDTASTLFIEWKTMEQKRPGDESNVSRDQKINELKKVYHMSYDYHKGQIESISANAYVPADIMRRVLCLVHTAFIPIKLYHLDTLSSLNTMRIRKHLVEPLDWLINADYFTMNHDEVVKEQIDRIITIRQQIMTYIDAQKDG